MSIERLVCGQAFSAAVAPYQEVVQAEGVRRYWHVLRRDTACGAARMCANNDVRVLEVERARTIL